MAETFLGNYFGPQGDAIAKFIEDNALGTYRGKSKGEAARQYGDVGQVGDTITLGQSLQDDEIRNKLLDSVLEARRMGDISGSGKVTEGLEIDPDIQDIGTAAKNYSDFAGFAALERVLGRDEASKQIQNMMGDLPGFGGGQFTSRQFPGTETGTPDDSRAPFEMEAPSTSPGMFDGIDFGTIEALDNQSMAAKLLDERRRQQGQTPREAIDLLQQEKAQDPTQSMAMGESGDVDEGGSIEGDGQFNPSEAFMDATKEIYKSQGEELRAPDGRLSEAERIEYYKQKFADATGLDISGEPDNRDALMAFGLALMQNKAGKGFNVGKMLSSIGQAGQAALPELKAARKKAEAASIAAGKFALEQIQRGENAKAALAAEQRLAAREAQMKLLEFEREVYLKKLENKGKSDKIEDSKKFEIIPGLDIMLGAYDGRSVFTRPEFAARSIGNAYRTTQVAMGELSNLEDAVLDIKNSGSPAFKIFADRANTFLVGLGMKDPNVTFGEDGVSPEQKSIAIRDSLIAEFKRFLTQETGNGISNVDIQNMERLMGKMDIFGNPEDALNRINQVRGIFEAKAKALTPFISDLTDKYYYRSDEQYQKAQSALAISMGIAGSDKKVEQTDGRFVVDLTGK